ncbi:unnamed protein product [Cyprideis torosa]|uniref:Protein chico n=1 Tax=Cyprideis torosa TaxID=163714 RepID=A0A7R8ZKK9_9CRUS|nr:unnamed protein product [Cyprideis torosa]CAG0881916.1 unnamed protein product [Cyprideis torosa]
MSASNVIIEGYVKHRDGKKWKTRWAVLTRLSPVAGFTLDKESNTLCILCDEVMVLMAFDSRETLIQWQVKVQRYLGESSPFEVTLVSVPNKSKLSPGPARIHVLAHRFCLTMGVPPKVCHQWRTEALRRFGIVETKFCFEGGSACGPRGEGVFVLTCDQLAELQTAFQCSADGMAFTSIRKRIGVPRKNSGLPSSPRRMQYNDSGTCGCPRTAGPYGQSWIAHGPLCQWESESMESAYLSSASDCYLLNRTPSATGNGARPFPTSFTAEDSLSQHILQRPKGFRDRSVGRRRSREQDESSTFSDGASSAGSGRSIPGVPGGFGTPRSDICNDERGCGDMSSSYTSYARRPGVPSEIYQASSLMSSGSSSIGYASGTTSWSSGSNNDYPPSARTDLPGRNPHVPIELPARNAPSIELPLRNQPLVSVLPPRNQSGNEHPLAAPSTKKVPPQTLSTCSDDPWNKPLPCPASPAVLESNGPAANGALKGGETCKKDLCTCGRPIAPPVPSLSPPPPLPARCPTMLSPHEPASMPRDPATIAFGTPGHPSEDEEACYQRPSSIPVPVKLNQSLSQEFYDIPRSNPPRVNSPAFERPASVATSVSSPGDFYDTPQPISCGCGQTKISPMIPMSTSGHNLAHALELYDVPQKITCNCDPAFLLQVGQFRNSKKADPSSCASNEAPARPSQPKPKWSYSNTCSEHPSTRIYENLRLDKNALSGPSEDPPSPAPSGSNPQENNYQILEIPSPRLQNGICEKNSPGGQSSNASVTPDSPESCNTVIKVPSHLLERLKRTQELRQKHRQDKFSPTSLRSMANRRSGLKFNTFPKNVLRSAGHLDSHVFVNSKRR